jgi:hypothetical protein
MVDDDELIPANCDLCPAAVICISPQRRWVGGLDRSGDGLS